jgi:DNA-binding MarR family transcriptional regulator
MSTRARPFYDGKTYAHGDSVGHRLFHVVQAIKREIDQRMAEHGLTDAQWKPLWMLSIGRAGTANELARCSHIDAGAMTRMVDRLEAKGLLERVRSDTDRRVVQLKLTPAGEDAVAHVPHVLAEVNNEFLRGFSTEQFQQLDAALTRMLANGEALRTAAGEVGA